MTGKEICAICMDDMIAADDIACFPCTGLHKMHTTCAKTWCDHRGRATCPMCKWEYMEAQASPMQLSLLLQRADESLSSLRNSD